MIAVCTCSRATATAVAGVPVHVMSPADALTHLERMAACSATHVVNNIASDPIVRAADIPELRWALRDADLNLPDGTPLVWAARWLGAEGARKRVYGPDFLLAAAGLIRDPPLRHGFVGGTPLVLDDLRARLLGQFPAIDIAASYAPPVRAVTGDAVAEDIHLLRERARAPIDLLWVGLGTPKQQIWAHQARQHDVARVIVTVGAAFDFVSGAKRAAPRWMGPVGLEWAFRLATEPRRLGRRYLIGNPRFVAAVVRQRSQVGRP